MKKIALFTSIILLFSCEVIQKNKAVEYNNSLISEQEKVADRINEFIELITTSDSFSYPLIQEKRKEVLESISKGIEKVEKIGGFDDSDEFQNSIMNVLQAYRNGVENEYTEMANYRILPAELQTPGKYFETQDLAFVADNLISIAEENFIDAQKVFAEKHQIELSLGTSF
jgi:hypothetical protein